MTLSRDYTLAEIDAMRKAVMDGLPDAIGATIEDRLRTYMMAGVTLADLRGGVAKEPDMFEDEG